MFFPDARAPTEVEGLIAVGGEFSAEILAEAYSKAIFPWPHEGLPILWFSPDPRGILDFSDFHVPHSLQKFCRKKMDWTFTLNQQFPEVMEQCRLQSRPGQDGTWILPEMQKAYFELFEQGKAMSLEVLQSGKLIGGIYGVLMEDRFSGESMFHLETNASKFALWMLVLELQKRGQKWMDIQMVTPLLAAFGGKYISRNKFLERCGL
jgi:leucyl/phenylalanyl-tRNA--protein transferase